ncbi:MAG: hypothetical protein GVY10_01000 [Verrucomicrobia bacterium]|jgi:hypothetical protein|nr:hypothetical protein [Verrucomicrobiota bacterium]
MSRRKGSFFVVAGLLLGCLLQAAVLEQGMTPDEVEAILGEPNGSRELVDGRIWVYSGNITLIFVEGALAEASGVEMVVSEAAEPTMEEPPPMEEPSPEPDEKADPPAEDPPEQEKEPPAAPAQGEPSPEEEAEPREQGAADPTIVPAGEEAEAVSGDGGILPQELLVAVVVTLLQFGILWIACRITGIEAYAVSLLFIAVMDRLVIHWIQWVFLSFLDFPTTFHADSLVSFLVMLGMFMKFTSAKSLPSALKVVVASKVLGIIAAYVLVMVVLFNM